MDPALAYAALRIVFRVEAERHQRLLARLRAADEGLSHAEWRFLVFDGFWSMSKLGHVLFVCLLFCCVDDPQTKTIPR